MWVFDWQGNQYRINIYIITLLHYKNPVGLSPDGLTTMAAIYITTEARSPEGIECASLGIRTLVINGSGGRE